MRRLLVGLGFAAAMLLSGCRSIYCERIAFDLAGAERELLERQQFLHPPTMVVHQAAAPVCAYQRVLEAQDREAIFVRLVDEAALGGKLYAVAGLKQIGSLRYAQLRDSVAQRHGEESLEEREADVVSTVAFGRLLQAIDETSLANDLATAYTGDPPW